MSNFLLLDDKDLSICERLAQSVRSGATEQSLLLQCKRAADQLEEPNFASFYVGLLLVLKGKLEAGLAFLSYAKDDPFCAVIIRYLKAHGNLKLSAPSWSEIESFHVWSRSEIATRQIETTTSFFERIFKREAASNRSEIPTIIDIGTGDGRLISSLVNQLAKMYELRGVKLILVDQLSSALQIAHDYCRRNITVPMQIQLICSQLESISHSSLTSADEDRVWFLNSAACLHHLPRDLKVMTLNKLRKIAKTLIITELEGNHDAPESGSPQLMWSVFRFYGSLIEDVFKSHFSRNERESCISGLLLREAIAIIGNNYPNRQNFHTLLEDWVEILKETGAATTVAECKELTSSGLRTMTIHATY